MSYSCSEIFILSERNSVDATGHTSLFAARHSHERTHLIRFVSLTKKREYLWVAFDDIEPDGMGIARDHGATMQYDEYFFAMPQHRTQATKSWNCHTKNYYLFFFSLVLSKNYGSQSTVFGIVSFSQKYSL